MNKNLLESKMKLYADKRKDLAEALSISTTRLSAKINCTHGAEFKQSEIEVIANRYDLTSEEIDNIFFAKRVS